MIGQRIHQLRNERGLSLSELAEKASIAKSYLSNVERGIQSNPSIQVIEKIAAALDVSIESILVGTTEGGELDSGWYQLVLEAMASGVNKEQFREMLEFHKWKTSQQPKD